MRQATILRLIFAVLMLAPFSCSSAAAAELTSLQKQGYALAERMCAGCHAVGRTGRSPHLGAPPFRELDRRVDIDTFVARLREGLTSGHPDMPTFRFSRQDARSFTAYLRAIQAQ